MKYAIFDEQGFPKAFYSPDIHGDNIPKEAIEITDEQWQEFISNQGKRKWDFEKKEVVPYEPPPPSLDELKQQKKAGIKRAFEEELKKGYLTSFGFKVDSKLDDLNNFDVTLKFAEMAGMTSVTIRDYDNITRTLTFDEFKQMCVELGQHIQQQFQKKWDLQAQVDEVTTEEELNNISW